MYKIGATILKELLLVFRDRAGMLVLFLMPALLVLVITLVQENVMKTMGEKSYPAGLSKRQRGFTSRWSRPSSHNFGWIVSVSRHETAWRLLTRPIFGVHINLK